MTTTLNPQDPSNFTRDGGQTVTPGNVLTLTDTASGDFVALFANDSDAVVGNEIDIVATFQVRATAPNNVDCANRIVINDGVSRSAIAACILQNGTRGIGLLSLGSASDPASYPFFVAADWQAAPITVRLRRTATGDAELIEVNGVPPNPRALLTVDKLPGKTRGIASVEFGSASPEAECTVEYAAFRSEKVANPATGKLSFTRFRLNDADSTDRIRLRADYTLGANSNGLNPAGETVQIKLSTPAGGQFYPSPDFNPLSGFTAAGPLKKQRYTLTDSERTRTGIEQLVIDEDPNSTGAIVLRDAQTTLVAAMDFSTVNVEISIGTGAAEDKLTGTASLVQKPAGSGQWQLKTEP